MDFNDWLNSGDDDPGELPVINTVIRTNLDGWENLESRLQESIARIFQKRERGDVIEWAEAKAIIPAGEGQPRPGKYREENGPVMGAPQRAFSDPRVRQITLLIGAQVGKSRSIWNMVGWAIDWAPGPITMVYPEDETAETKRDEDFVPGWNATDCLREKLMPDPEEKLKPMKGRRKAKSRNSRWVFPDGWLRFVSAKSYSRVKASPAMYVFIDEHAECGHNAAGSIEMALFQRQREYPNAKFVRASTPKGSAKTCLTTLAYMKGDQSIPFVKCQNPACQHDHTLEWENVHIERNSKGELIAEGHEYRCPKCAHAHSDAQRFVMLQEVEWRSMAIHTCCGVDWDPAQTGSWGPEDPIGRSHQCPECGSLSDQSHKSYRCGALYSTRVALADLVKLWIDAQGSIADLMQFYNQTLARNFEPMGSAGDLAKDLQGRRLDYQSIWGPGVQVPRPVKFLVMAVDVQGDRLEWEIRGYGAGEESWGIAFGVISIPPTQKEAWMALHRVRIRPYVGVDGRMYPVSLCGIDIGQGGDLAKAAMAYVTPNKGSGVYALRGDSRGDLFQPYDPSRMKHKTRHDVIGTDEAKRVLLMRMKLRYKGDERPETTAKPGMMHWPADSFNRQTGEVLIDTGYTDGYFEQATNFQEGLVYDRRTGQARTKWTDVDTTVRQEALDLLNYCNGGARKMMKIHNVMHIEHVPDQWIAATDPRVMALLDQLDAPSLSPSRKPQPQPVDQDPTPPRKWKFAPVGAGEDPGARPGQHRAGNAGRYGATRPGMRKGDF